VSKKQPVWAQTLVGQTNELVDAFAECMLPAAQHGLTVKPEDVRTFLVTAFINLSQQVALLPNRLYTSSSNDDALDILLPVPRREKATKSAYALRRWLAREIFECEIPRKPPKRATKSVGPARNARYKAWIRSVPCCVCGLEPPERRRTRDGMAAWGKKPQIIHGSLYAETATRKMRTPTIDWDELISNSGTKWISLAWVNVRVVRQCLPEFRAPKALEPSRVTRSPSPQLTLSLCCAAFSLVYSAVQNSGV
jgi:hypothetical protein